MKLKDCKSGFYRDIEDNEYPNCTIYHVFENKEEDKDKFPLLVDTYIFEKKENGINIFVSHEDGVNPENFDTVNAVELHRKMEVVVSSYNAAYITLREVKLNNEQLLEKIYKMASKEANNGDYTDKNVKFALRILRALENK